MSSIAIPNVQVTQPGVEVAVVTPLRVDAGDTVVIGNVTITPSDTSTMSVSAASMTTTDTDIGGTIYPAGQAVTYTLTVTGTLAKDRQASIRFDYTTQTGDERIVSQPILLVPKFTATGGVAVFGGGLIESLATAPASALYPGHYDIDTSSGPFTVLLREVKGEWLFLDPLDTTTTNNLTIGTSSQTFNGQTGPLVMDGEVLACRVYNVAGGSAFKVTI